MSHNDNKFTNDNRIQIHTNDNKIKNYCHVTQQFDLKNKLQSLLRKLIFRWETHMKLTFQEVVVYVNQELGK